MKLFFLFFLINSFFSFSFSYYENIKILDNLPLCSNLLNTKEFQTSFIAKQRYIENYYKPIYNYSNSYITLSCYSITIHLDNITYYNFNNFINKIDYNESIRRIIIITKEDSQVNHSSIINIEKILDKIITNKPWWRIQNHESHSILHIIIDKIAREWEPFIRFIGSIQYPPAEICKKIPIVIGKEDCIHPGWGAVYGMYGSLHRIFPYSIITPYVSISNDPLQDTAFIKGSDCPNELNKWNCAFLPTTNCTLPSIITDCRKDHCIPQPNYDAGIVFTHADHDGQLIDLHKESDEVKLKYQTEIYYSYSKELAQKGYFIHPQYKYILPVNRTLYILAGDDVHDAYAEYAGYGMYILLRMNYWYRQQVSHYIHSYRLSTKPTFHANSDCVAIHIRRGDRVSIHSKYHMREICYNASHPPNLCLNGNDELKECDVTSDMWCGNVPFGSIELPRTLERISQLLPPISSNEFRNILLLSDDYDWILQETEKIRQDSNSPYKNWNFYHPPPPNSLLDKSKQKNFYEKYHLIRSEGGTASGVYLQATFQLVQQCSAFIGHFGSSFTGLLYSIMCHRHRGLEGICPPMYDIKWDKEYYNKLDEEYAAMREGNKKNTRQRKTKNLREINRKN